MTDAEEDVFRRQLELAIEHGLPAMVHTPHRDKAAGTKRTLDLVQQTNIEPGMVVVDHLNEVTVEMVKESGCWMGFSIYPDTKMDPHRMVAILQEHGLDRVLVNSAADWGRSEPLTTVHTGEAMLAAGFSEDDGGQVRCRKTVGFGGQSGRRRGEASPGATATFEGDSIVRGKRNDREA